MPRRKQRRSPVTRYEGQFAPEWFYPLARMIHDKKAAEAVQDYAAEPNGDDSFFENPVSAEKIEGFALVATKGAYVYMRGVVVAGPGVYRRYAVRAPRSQFFEVYGGADAT